MIPKSDMVADLYVLGKSQFSKIQLHICNNNNTNPFCLHV